MEVWLPSIIEGIVLIFSLLGVITRSSNKIKELETRQDVLEKRITDMAITVNTVQSGFSKIETSLARIETDLKWVCAQTKQPGVIAESFKDR